MAHVARVLRLVVVPALHKRLREEPPQTSHPRVLLLGRRILHDLVLMTGSVVCQLDEHLIRVFQAASGPLANYMQAAHAVAPLLMTSKQGLQPLLDAFHWAVAGAFAEGARPGDYIQLWATLRWLNLAAEAIGSLQCPVRRLWLFRMMHIDVYRERGSVVQPLAHIVHMSYKHPNAHVARY